MKKRYPFITLLLSLLFVGCSPVSISRIGPARPNRGQGCEVEVLPPGETPPHPYKDIGVVHLTNCQEYTSGPCRRWLADAVCTLGGNVAYLIDPTPPKNDIDAINFHITAGVYIDNKSMPTDTTPGCNAPPPTEEEPEMQRCMD